MASLTWGHLLLFAALLDGAVALVMWRRWSGYSSNGPGTPLYARGRDARRLAILAAASALLFAAVALLTPLWRLALI